MRVAILFFIFSCLPDFLFSINKGLSSKVDRLKRGDGITLHRGPGRIKGTNLRLVWQAVLKTRDTMLFNFASKVYLHSEQLTTASDYDKSFQHTCRHACMHEDRYTHNTYRHRHIHTQRHTRTCAHTQTHTVPFLIDWQDMQLIMMTLDPCFSSQS